MGQIGNISITVLGWQMDYWKVKTYRKETYLVKTIGLFVSCWLYTIHLKSFQKPCLILSNTCNFALESMPLRSILSLHSFWHILFRHGEKQQQQQKQTIYIYIYHQQEHIVHHMRIVRGIDCHVAISIAASQKLPFFRGGDMFGPSNRQIPAIQHYNLASVQSSGK